MFQALHQLEIYGDNTSHDIGYVADLSDFKISSEDLTNLFSNEPKRLKKMISQLLKMKMILIP